MVTEKTLLKFVQAGVWFYLEGMSGVGKSYTVHKLAKLRGGKCVEVRVASLDPADLGGIPQANGDSYERLVPQWAKSLGPKDILFLDELNQATPDQLLACFSLTDVNPTFGGFFNFPKGVFVCAAGNTDAENAYLTALPKPLLPGRLVKLEFTPDPDLFQQITGIPKSADILKNCQVAPRDLERCWKMLSAGITEEEYLYASFTRGMQDKAVSLLKLVMPKNITNAVYQANDAGRTLRESDVSRV